MPFVVQNRISTLMFSEIVDGDICKESGKNDEETVLAITDHPVRTEKTRVMKKRQVKRRFLMKKIPMKKKPPMKKKIPRKKKILN